MLNVDSITCLPTQLYCFHPNELCIRKLHSKALTGASSRPSLSAKGYPELFLGQFGYDQGWGVQLG